MEKDMENECKLSDSYCLSTYSRDDAPQIVHSLSNPLVAKQLRQVPTPYTMADAMAWLDDLEDEGNHSDTAPIRWALRDTSSGKLIGDFSLRPATTAGTYSLGYWLAIEYWGKGIMTRVVAEVLGIVRKEIPTVITSGDSDSPRAELCKSTCIGEERISTSGRTYWSVVRDPSL